jgi:putative NADH-flavin reductase
MLDHFKKKRKMKIVVFGGTGAVGQIVVNKLLAKGKKVCVLTRQAKEPKDNLEYVIGDVLHPNTVEACIEKDDIVIVALGFNNSPFGTMSKGTANIIAAMDKQGTKRMVCLSSHGVGESWNYLPEAFREIVKHNEILKHAFEDHAVQEENVKNSNLDWTIVRPTEIISIPETGTYSVNERRPNPKYHISKHDVAQFIVDETLEPKHFRETCLITD